MSNKTIGSSQFLLPIRAFSVVFLLLWLAFGIQAQQTSGSISGVVVDAQGAVVVGAKVTVTDQRQGSVRESTTGSEGGFTFTPLQPSEYTLVVEAPGFSKMEQKDIRLFASTRLALPRITLAVGAITQTVEVTASAAMLQTQSSERSGVITGSQLVELALNGRNYADLMKTVPGTNADSQNVNGRRGETNNLIMDGVTTMDSGNNGFNKVALNTDAIAEFKMLTNSQQAEYGRTAGAAVQIVTKSGSREFHGSGYIFHRHEDLNANTWANNAQSILRPRYRFNTPGFTIGGPVILPKLHYFRDKLFFFVAGDFTRQLRLGSQNNLTVPTLAERDGDFGLTHLANGSLVTIKDPSNNFAPFPLNFIPPDRRNSDGVKILKFYPQPNLAGIPGYNYTVQAPIQDNPRQHIVRLDYNITDRWRVYGRAIIDPRPITTVYGDQNSNTSLAMGKGFSAPQNGSTHMVNVTTIIRPTLTNEFIAGRAWNEIGAVPLDDTYMMSRLGLQFKTLYPDADALHMIPNFSWGGVPSAPTTNFRGLPYYNQNPTKDITDNIAMLRGKHTMKAGFFRSSTLKQQVNSVYVSGNLAFDQDAANPGDTNWAFSNAMLGNYKSFSQASVFNDLFFRLQNLEWYVQDNWKVSRDFTLDYGVRFAYVQPNYEQNNQISSWLPSLYDPTKAISLYQPALDANGKQVAKNPLTGQLVPRVLLGAAVPGSGDVLNGFRQQGQGGFPKGLIYGRGVHYGPRFGFAWNPGGRSTVIRAGIGIFYDRIQGNITMNQSSNPPMVLTPQVFYGNLSTLGAAGSNVFPGNAAGLSPDGHVPTTYNWNFTIQQKLPFQTAIDVAYVGSDSNHLPFIQTPNDPPLGSAWLPSNQDPTLTPKFDGTTTLPVNLTRPYVGVNEARVNNWGGSSTYHSLQVALNHHMTKGVEFGVTYTFGKALGAVSDRDTVIRSGQNRNTFYGPLSFDRRHVFVGSYSYSFPKVARAGFLNNPVARVALNGWIISGLTTFQSGSPQSISISSMSVGSVNAVSGAALNRMITGSETIGPRPILLGSPVLSKGAQTVYARFNTSVVRPALKGSTGNDSPQYAYYGPGINNWDISVFKNISYWRGEGRYIQMRVESFNAFNHTQFSGVANSAIFDSAGNLSNLPKALGGTVGWGAFGAYNGSRSGRVIQLAAKIYF